MRSQQGTVSLAYRERGGYLLPVLDALGVPPESQLLVFSKTGIQGAATGPQNPRAIFFDDAVVVGYIPGARFLELAAHDPEQGVVFYTIDQSGRRRSGPHAPHQLSHLPRVVEHARSARDDQPQHVHAR